MIEEIEAWFPLLASLQREEIHVWFCGPEDDRWYHCLAIEGHESGASVPLRELFRRAWLFRATRMIVVHNHPDGDCTPSAEDWDFTDRVAALGHECDVAMVDHVVVGLAMSGEVESFSFAMARGLTPVKEAEWPICIGSESA